jgi:Trypsin
MSFVSTSYIGSNVLVGSFVYNSTSGEMAQWRNIVGKMVVHPDYVGRANGFQHDVMLFKIEPVTYKNLRPVDLNTLMSNPRKGQKLTAIGYGSTVPNDGKNVTLAFSDKLMKVTLDASGFNHCNKAVGGGLDEEVQFCAYAKDKDTCQGKCFYRDTVCI